MRNACAMLVQWRQAKSDVYICTFAFVKANGGHMGPGSTSYHSLFFDPTPCPNPWLNVAFSIPLSPYSLVPICLLHSPIHHPIHLLPQSPHNNVVYPYPVPHPPPFYPNMSENLTGRRLTRFAHAQIDLFSLITVPKWRDLLHMYLPCWYSFV